MKKILLKTLAVCLMISAAALPANADKLFRFGVKAGVNINKMHLSNVATNLDEKNRAGFTAGLMTEFKVPIIGLGFDASLMFTRLYSKTQVQTLDIARSAGETTLNQSFFEIPINLKYKFEFPAVASIVAPYIFTGPSFAFRVSGNDNWFKTKTFQPSWNVGAGVELFRHLQIGASYSFGISNIYKAVVTEEGVSDNIKLRNNYWTVTAAYLF